MICWIVNMLDEFVLILNLNDEVLYVNIWFRVLVKLVLDRKFNVLYIKINLFFE